MARRQSNTSDLEWPSVGPFRSFAQLQKAIADRKASLGVDPLAAARWADAHLNSFKKSFIAALSLLLIASAVASVIGAVWFANYWLLAAVPIQAAVFYLAQPALKFQRWATVGGVVLIFVFIEFLLSGLITPATLAAYAALTFASVRASGFVTNSAFRKALVADESLFIAAYSSRLCSIREKETKKVYEHRD